MAHPDLLCRVASGPAIGVGRMQVLAKPGRCSLRHLVQRALFLKQMGGTWHHLQLTVPAQHGQRLLVEHQHFTVQCTHDEQTRAPHLLQSGVPFNIIALWLGHESTNTTHRYVEANLEMKEKALARLEAPDIKLKRFRAGDELMRFLQTL